MKKNIYCPHCGRKTGEVETVSTMALPTKCKKCNILVVYIGETGEVKTQEIPQRKTSSGKRFY